MLNFANILTMSRIAAIPAIVGLLLIQGLVWHWIALALFILACVTDWFDGYVARRLDQVSPLGRFLDPIADKLVVAAVLLILVSIGHIDGWSILAALVILCREILVSGLREFLAELRVGVPVSMLAPAAFSMATWASSPTLCEPGNIRCSNRCAKPVRRAGSFTGPA